MTGFFQSIVTVGLFILILGVLVVIHELGHFFTARAFRVRVLEFGIGIIGQRIGRECGSVRRGLRRHCRTRR